MPDPLRGPEPSPVAGGTGKALLRHLPPPPGRVLLVPTAADLAALLREAGYEVEEDAEAADAAPAAAIAVFSPPPGTGLPALLAALRPRLAGGGRLLVTGALPAEEGRLLVRGLYETGFAIVAEEPGAALTVARPAAHRVRPWRPGDETAILDLFVRAFHHRRSVERWRWAYAENPYGNHRISLAVDAEGRLAAHYAGYPVRMWSEDVLGGGPRAVDCLQIGDTMTAPEARRVGRGGTNLLTRTVRHFYATWCEGRVAFNLGANTGKIQRFSRRTAGARRLEPVPFRTRPLPGPPFAAPGPLAGRLGGWRVERLAGPGAFDERFDDLWRRCRGAYRLLVERDRRYLAWRYAAPDVDYHLWTVSRRGRLAGWAVFRRHDERLIWGDALFDPRQPRAAAMLLSRATAAPEHRDARRVEGWLGDRPAWWGRIVAGLGFTAEPEPEDLGFVYVPFAVDPGAAFAEHLYYTKGDTDLF